MTTPKRPPVQAIQLFSKCIPLLTAWLAFPFAIAERHYLGALIIQLVGGISTIILLWPKEPRP